MKVRIFSLCVLCLMFTVATSAQDSQPTYQPPQQLASVDNQGIRNYKLGPGDVLDVRVFGQPDLNTIVEVDSDGNISSLPFLEKPVPARCRNEKEVQKDIATAYAKYLKNPQLCLVLCDKLLEFKCSARSV